MRYLALLLLALLPGALAGQDSTVTATVTQIAGQDVYVNAGSDAGLRAGDTITVRRAATGPVLGRMTVSAATGSRALLGFLDAPFPLTRGDDLFLGLHDVAEPAAAPARPARVADTRPPRTMSNGAILHGRLLLDVDGNRSTTRGFGSDPQSTSREYATPSASLRLQVTRLPGNMELSTDVRARYRYTSSDIISPATAVRVYEASLTKRFPAAGVMVRAGRFYDPYEYFSGYWDGVMVHAGDEGFGLAALAGFEPKRGNEGFSADVPKASLVAHASRIRGRSGIRTDVSVHRVMPRDSSPDHTFAGWSQVVWTGRLSFSHNLQVDRNPASGNWNVTRLLTRLALPLGPSLTVHGGYSIQQPYQLGTTFGAIPFRRDRASGGFDVRLSGASIGADVTTGRQEGLEDTWSYSGSVYRAPRGLHGIGLGLTGTRWTGGTSEGLLIAPSLDRQFGRLTLRAGYQYSRTDFGVLSLTTHAADLGSTVPLGPRTGLTLRARWQSGQLSSTGLYAGFWYGF